MRRWVWFLLPNPSTQPRVGRSVVLLCGFVDEWLQQEPRLRANSAFETPNQKLDCRPCGVVRAGVDGLEGKPMLVRHPCGAEAGDGGPRSMMACEQLAENRRGSVIVEQKTKITIRRDIKTRRGTIASTVKRTSTRFRVWLNKAQNKITYLKQKSVPIKWPV